MDSFEDTANYVVSQKNNLRICGNFCCNILGKLNFKMLIGGVCSMSYSNLKHLFTLYTLTSVCMFSILFIQSQFPLAGNNLPYFHGLITGFRGDISVRNWMLVTLG